MKYDKPQVVLLGSAMSSGLRLLWRLGNTSLGISLYATSTAYEADE